MILVKNWEFPLCLFLAKTSYELVFDNQLVRKMTGQLLDDKTYIVFLSTSPFSPA